METNNNESGGRYQRPRWIIRGLGALLMLYVALLIVQKVNYLKNTFVNTKPANTISVSGEGKVTATPNLATVDLGVTSQGNTAQSVTDQNNAAVNKVIAFIKSQGVADADIQTSQLSLNPQQDYSNGAPKITGYQVNQTVTVKVHNVDKSETQLDNILDGAVTNGANQINDVNLSVEDPSALQEQAQEAAIADAKQKAQKLAQAAGLSLGKVVSVSESMPAQIQPFPMALNATAGLGMAAPSVAPQIQTGSQEIDETMTVTFEVK